MRSTNLIKKNNFKFILITILICCFSSCSKSESTPDNLSDADWKVSSTVSSSEAAAAIVLSGVTNTEWQAEVTEGKEWCSFSKGNLSATTKSGVLADGFNVLYIYYTSNSDKERHAKIAITFGGTTKKELQLTQLGVHQENLPAKIWAEIPELKANPNYIYTTHYGQISSKQVRNYSICFDKTKKAALWVAYPLHSIYVASGGRTDAWAFDPIVPESFQVNCVNGGFKYYNGNSYDRGHQIPSADRNSSSELNAQTFYMSNMTPQLSSLNQQMWAKLEEKVRGNNCSDTLYVVTGCYFGTDATNTHDAVGGVAPIPTNYFKLLLRTKTGVTKKAIKDCNESELISIGFWVDHKSYGNTQPPRTICTTVADIESKTGFKFFPQVSDAVKKQNDPNQWGI